MVNNEIFPENVDYSTFNLSRIHKTSFDMGKLIPIANIQTLPGDHIEIDVDSFIRGMPTLAPILEKCDLKINTFFVPHRILFNGFEEFISRSNSRSGVQNEGFVLPYFDAVSLASYFSGSNSKYDQKYFYGRLLDYLGVRPFEAVKSHGSGSGSFLSPFVSTILSQLSTLNCSLLPVLAYNKIYIDYYIPQRWLKYYRDTKNSNNFLCTLDSLLYDFQKGKISSKLSIPTFSDISSGASDNIKTILSNGLYGSSEFFKDDEFGSLNKTNRDFLSLFTIKDVFWNHDYFTNALPLPSMSEDVVLPIFGYENSKVSGLTGFTQDQMKKIGGTVRDLRQSIAMQHFLEKINIAGGRYHETMKVLWNEDINTNLLQMSEYIGGDIVPMFVNEIEQTTQVSETSNLGDLAGKPLSAGGSKKLTVNCNEYGQIMVLAHLVPKRSYSNKVDKAFMQLLPEDFPLPQFEGIGDESVSPLELGNFTGLSKHLIFGYVPRYSYYKTAVDEFSGEMRHDFAHWHLGEFNNSSKVSPDFLTVKVREDIFRVPSIPDKFLGTFDIKVIAKRKLSYNTPVGVSRI